MVSQRMKEIAVQTKITKFVSRSTKTDQIQTAHEAVMTTAVAMSSTATSTLNVAVEVAAVQTDKVRTKDIGFSTENFATSNDEEDEDIFFPCVEEIPIEASERLMKNKDSNR
eukprot:gene6201-6916_t